MSIKQDSFVSAFCGLIAAIIVVGIPTVSLCFMVGGVFLWVGERALSQTPEMAESILFYSFMGGLFLSAWFMMIIQKYIGPIINYINKPR
jgi:hypothetical protein